MGIKFDNIADVCLCGISVIALAVFCIGQVKADIQGSAVAGKPIINLVNVDTGPNNYVLRWDVSNLPSNTEHVVYNVWRCRYSKETGVLSAQLVGEVQDDTSFNAQGWFMDQQTHWRVTVGRVVTK